MLYDEDFVALFGVSISQNLILYLEKICSSCQLTIDNESNVFTVPCGCRLCGKCMKAKINEGTHGKIILNEFEKGNFI
jgi:hypothetical protein